MVTEFKIGTQHQSDYFPMEITVSGRHMIGLPEKIIILIWNTERMEGPDGLKDGFNFCIDLLIYLNLKPLNYMWMYSDPLLHLAGINHNTGHQSI